jgi:hypothetical protein
MIDPLDPSRSPSAARLRLIRDDVSWSDWSAIRERAYGRSRDDIEVVAGAIDDWPDTARLVASDPEQKIDPWWIEGQGTTPQPWLGLVRSLWVPPDEIVELRRDSAWVLEGLPGVTTWLVGQALEGELTAACRSMLPSLRRIDLSAFPGTAARLEAWVRALSPIAQLAFAGLAPRPQLIDVLNDSHASTLRSLTLVRAIVGSNGLKRLSRWREPSALRDLELREAAIDLGMLERTALPLFQQLHSLDLSDAVRGARTYSWLDAPRLTALSLRRIPLGSGAPALFAQAKLPSLRVLRLASTRLTTAGIAALVKSAWSRSLTHLDLRDNALDDDALAMLERLPAKWEEILLSGNRFSNDELARFADRNALAERRPGVYARRIS